MRTPVSDEASLRPAFSRADYAFDLDGAVRAHSVQLGAFVVLGRSPSRKGTPRLIGTSQIHLNDVADPLNLGNVVGAPSPSSGTAASSADRRSARADAWWSSAAGRGLWPPAHRPVALRAAAPPRRARSGR